MYKKKGLEPFNSNTRKSINLHDCLHFVHEIRSCYIHQSECYGTFKLHSYMYFDDVREITCATK